MLSFDCFCTCQLHKVTAFLVLFNGIEWNFRTFSPKPLNSHKQAALNESHMLTQMIHCTCRHHRQVPIHLKTLQPTKSGSLCQEKTL